MHYDLDYFRDKFNQSYSIDPLTGCWLWQRTITNNGYAIIWDGRIRKASAAHRVSYELHKGQIPEGLDLDHLCRVRHCVNPSHLEAVTRKVNTLRGIGPAAVNAQKTHCPKGHPYDEQNTYYAFNPQGGKGRHCLTCQNIRNNINSKIRSLKRVRKPRKTKLTEQDVVSIRKIYSEGGYSFAQLGKKYGVTPSAIAMVVWRKNWANVS